MPVLGLILFMAFMSGCSRGESAQDLFTKAQEALSRQDTAAVLANLNTILEDYPDSAAAPAALYFLAGLEQGTGADLEKAVGHLERIINDYPESEEAPKAMFQLGFLYANTLHDFDKAGKYYQEFLDKYPENDLAPSARFELDHLGEDPDVVLQSILARRRSVGSHERRPCLSSPRSRFPPLVHGVARAPRGRGIHHRSSQEPVPRFQRGVCRAPPVHARRRDPPHRLEDLRPHRSLLHQAIRGRDQPEILPAAGRQPFDGLQGGRRGNQAPVRLVPVRRPRLSHDTAAGRGGPGGLR
ncbi:MAG: tetratricopeptide repeat protein [Chlorobi bacterium]|nr:tetratricopeptide repeat protein [Chlorobiota bacterium]